jgi:hypothetical protein
VESLLQVAEDLCDRIETGEDIGITVVAELAKAVSNDLVN